MSYIGISMRTLFFYILIQVVYRIMGKREVARISIGDLTISILIAELVALGIENKTNDILYFILPILILVFLGIFQAYLELKHNNIKPIIDGKPSLIINKGKLNIKEMLKQRFSIDDLLLALRTNGIKSIDEVNYFLLENNGKPSIFKKNNKDDSYPLPLIIDGKLDLEVLFNIKRNEDWLNDILLRNGYKQEELLYAFYKDKRLFVIKK